MILRHAALHAVTCLAAVSLVAQEPSAPVTRPLLFANYYTWYHDGSHPERPFEGWARPQSRENPLALKKQREGEPPISSAVRPLAGLYDSRNRAVADWHVSLAESAGIDAFLVDWWGEHLHRDKNAEAGIIAACEAGGMKWAVLDERAQFHQELGDYAGWVIAAMKRYFPMSNYLRIDGRPVWYLYQVGKNPGLTANDFTLLRRRVEREVGPVYWIVDKISHDAKAARAGALDAVKTIPADWLATGGIDAFAFYSTFSNFEADGYEDAAGKYRHLAQLAHGAGRKMLLPVHPGHDNSYFRTAGDEYVMPRRGNETLRDYLRAAVDAKADFVMVTSWNEWPESTVIEPSEDWEDPYLYLRTLAQWKGRTFKIPPLPPGITSTPQRPAR